MALEQSESPAVQERRAELLLRWQELRREGRTIAAADLCTDCPELETLLEEQIKAFANVEGILGIETQEPAGAKYESVINRTTLPPADADATQVTGVSFQCKPSVPGYEIVAVLGRGGMGVVYQAKQVALNRMVALKMILSGGHASAQRLHRFRTEATAVARLQHPSVVQIYDIGDLDGQPYYSMEFVAGGSLDQQLAKALLPPRQAAQLLLQVAQAMHHAHQNGIVHRDLKPANILLTGSKDSAPKIADFGVAKLLDEDGPSLSGEPMGTPSYMAPEQALGRKQDQGPAIDVYALGAILYEMLTGRPPFRGESTLDTLEQVCSRDPVAPSQLQPGCPRDLETICLKCLRKEPDRRYPSAQELALDLQRFLQDQPIHARPTPPWERVLKWTKRKPAVAASVLLSAAAIIALLVVWIVFTAQLGRERDVARAAQGRAETKEVEADSARKDAEDEKSTAEHERDLARKQRERAEAMLERSLQLMEVTVPR
jgi:serine/threonine protein kinase